MPLPDVDSESWAQYSADQFTSSATDRINALAAAPTPDPGLVSHLGGGPSPDQASAGSTADMSPPPAASPSPEPVPAAPAPAPLPAPYAPVTAPLQAPQSAPTPTPAPAQPDWIAGALNAVDQAGGDVQKFAQGLQTGAGDLIGSALNAADAAGADVQKFVSALPPVPQQQDQSQQPGSVIGAGSVNGTPFQQRVYQEAAAAQNQSGVDPRIIATIASTETGSTGQGKGQLTLGIGTAAGDAGRGPIVWGNPTPEGGRQPSGFYAYTSGAEASQAFRSYIEKNQPQLVPLLGDANAFFDPNGPIRTSNYYVPTAEEAARAGGADQATRNYYANWAQTARDLGGSPQVGAADQADRVQTQTVRPQSSSGAGDISQFGDPQLTTDEAYAACGPAAAVRFAEREGRNPTLREAVDLAKQVGWTPQQGMAGLGSEKALMDKMGVPTNLVDGPQWDVFAKEAQTGNPVTISTAGHYFFADGYNPDTGAFHVGRSGLDLKGGAEWMTPAQMQNLMGTVQGGLLADNPQIPTPSTADQQSNPLDWLGRQKDALTSSIGNGVSALGSALQPQVSQPVATQTMPSDSLTDPIGTRYTLSPSGQPQAATTQPTTSAAPQDATSATPPPQGPLEAVKQKFSDAIDALGGLLAPHGASGEPLQPMTQQQMDTAYQNSGVRLPTSPLDALGGSGLGAPTSGEQATTERNAAIEQANPLRDVPVVGGATTLAAQAALDPTNLLLGAGPELGRAAADVAGSIPARLPAEATAGFASGADALAAARSAVGGTSRGAAIEATQAPEEANTVSQLSAWLPKRVGQPGISVEPQGVPGVPGVPGTPRPEWGTSVVYRDETGNPQGILSITNDASGNPDVAEVAVNPALQRQGIATQLYQAAKDAGINVDAVTGRGGYTPQGAAFAQSRIDRGLVGPPAGGGPPRPPAPPTVPPGGGGQPPYQSVMPAGTFETPPPPSSGIGDRIANVQRNLTRTFTDRQVDVNQVQQAYQRALGRPLNADEMAAELQRLSPDAAAAVKIDEGLKPAIQSVNAIPNGQAALRDYVTLRSNVEVAQGLGNDARNFSGGMTAADSQARIAQMQDQLGPQQFAKVQQAADQITSFNQDLRQRLVDSGVLSPQQADQMEAMYPNWAKTRILDYMADPAGGQGAGTKLGLADRNLRQYTLEGTTRAREDPIASTVAYAHQVEGMANKNEAFQAMLKIDQESPNPQLRPVPQDFSPTKNQVTMVGFQNGQKFKYVTDNKALGEAINGAGTMSAPSWVSGWSKFVRATATSRNPLFLAGNAALDIPTYAFRSTIREGGPTPPALGRVFGELAKGYADAFQGLLQGEYRGAGTSAFLKAGGGQSGYFTGSEGEASQRIADLQRSNIFQVNSKADLLRLTKDVLTLKPVEGLGERIELGPRVAAYNLAKQRGANPVQAATEGRTVTVDFSQGGTVTKYINNFVPFFNVGFQGPAQLIRAFRENPKAFVATTGTLIGLPSVAAEVWNHADPQRWQDYQDVPDYVKNQGIVVMLPGNVGTDAQGNRKPSYAVLKLREWAPFAQIARSAADVAFGDNQRTWGQMAASIGTGLSPTNATSVSQVGSEPLAGIPALPAALQLQQNRDFFRNRNIVTTRNDQNASALAKGLAPIMQRAVDAAGMNAEIRPSAIDFFIRDQGAGAGGAALGASDLAAGTPRQDTTAQSLPGAGGLIGRFSGSQTGQNLQSSRDVGLTPSAREILRSNGITTTPGAVSSTAEGVPLKLDEEARYQDLFSRYSDDAIQRAARASDWGQLSQKGKQARVQDMIDAARTKAGMEVLRSIPVAEKQRRLRVGATAP